MDESRCVRHDPCPKCGSSDALAVYADGHTHCFGMGCGHHTHADGHQQQRRKPIAANLIAEWKYQDLNKRNLTEETLQKWNYGICKYGGKTCHVANIYSIDGSQVVAQKIRTPSKDFILLGSLDEAGLFGQNLFRDGGKMVVITEGELDAMSVSQMQSHKWPVASIPNGAAGAKKSIMRSLEWLEKFEKVIFMFDSDEAGKAAAVECAELLTPGKAFIASLPLKDASDMLVAGRIKETIDAMWGAKEFRPDGIVSGTDIVGRVMNARDIPSTPYPWECMNRMLRGMRKGEIVLFGAGTGMGKSQICKEIILHMHDTTDEKFGVVCLEESLETSGLILASLRLNQRVSVDRKAVSAEDLKTALDSTIGSGRFYLFDHFGSMDSDNLLARIRYMVRGLGCETILLDHISIAVSGNESDNERKDLDVLMTKLRSLVEELQCRMLIVSHLNTPEGKSHEEGGRVTLRHFRGTRSLTQLANIVIAVEGDQQSEETKSHRVLRALKNRYTGELGEMGTLIWNNNTGRLSEFDFETAEAAPQEQGSDV